MKKKRVVYVIYGQFGYVVGSVYYAKYLNNLGYEVGIICADINLPKVKTEDGVTVKYVSLAGCKNGFEKRIRFIKGCIALKGNYDIFVIRYFLFCSIIGTLLFGKKVYLDYRTGALFPNKIKTGLFNFINRIEMVFFHKIFILSKDLAKDIRLPKSKYIWLPLGADDLSSGLPKEYSNNLNILYLGTLNKRNIDESVVGFSRFYREYKDKFNNISFHIIAKGDECEIKKLVDTIQKEKVNNVVIFHGPKTHAECKQWFDYCNCGLAYVPETFYYDHQPSTKIFEYNLSGLVCIATSTTENKKVINEHNGVLCHSTPDSIYKALIKLYETKKKFSWNKIKESQKYFSWESIVERVFDTEFRSLK